MGEHWPLIEALMGGTAAMRAAKESLSAPRTSRGSRKTTNIVWKTSTLFPAFERTRRRDGWQAVQQGGDAFPRIRRHAHRGARRRTSTAKAGTCTAFSIRR
ncbi:hypothetical protein ACU4GD_28040 [Cupriavidus basilensis]